MADDWVDPRDEELFAELLRLKRLLREKRDVVQHPNTEGELESLKFSKADLSLGPPEPIRSGSEPKAWHTLASVALLIAFFLRDRSNRRSSKK